VYLVEASENLRSAQHRLLCGDNPLAKNEIGYESKSKHDDGLKIVWTEDVRFVPRKADKTPFIVAHEFFDALPIHIFQAATPAPGEDVTIQTPTGPIRPERKLPKQNFWKEMQVTPKPPHRLKEGEVDLSADVDFLALAEAAINASPGVEVHGPVDQARFLTAMGIEERAAQLVKRAVDKERGGGSDSKDKTELTEIVKRVESGWKRLVDRSPQGMGRLYQVMALLPYHADKQDRPPRRPVGFGGDVTI
jgi:SAM-dependent MidA family methyltransferase